MQNMSNWDLYNMLAVFCMNTYTIDVVNRMNARRDAKMNLKHSEYIEQGHSSAWVYVTDQDNIVVAVKGTTRHHVPHWIVDLNFIPQRHAASKGWVHSGFYQQALRVWPEVDYHVRSLRKPHSKIYITGHSMGGAVAVHLAEMLSHSGFDIDELVTFGQPRVGDKVFCNHLVNLKNFRYHRLVNNTDFVAQLPPEFLGYQHTGVEIYFNRDGGISKNTAAQRARDAVVGVRNLLKKNAAPQWWCDHNIRHYVYHIRKIQKSLTKITNNRNI